MDTMHYDAIVRREGRTLLAEFRDCPGCQTFAEDGDALACDMREALEGWLEAHLVSGQSPPRPKTRRAPAGATLAHVPVRAGLAAALRVRWARQDQKLTQSELGKLAGVTQQQIAKIEDPDENPSIETLEKVARALGLALEVDLVPPRATVSVPLARELETRRRARAGMPSLATARARRQPKGRPV